jgi:hypothetical protein
MIDHLLAVFTPVGHAGPDGAVHEESQHPLTCTCGPATPTPDHLDGHFLSVFTPVHRTGHDGMTHTVIQP